MKGRTGVMAALLALTAALAFVAVAYATPNRAAVSTTRNGRNLLPAPRLA